MCTKKANARVFIYVDDALRARLNLYKTILGVQDTGTMDQNDTIRALLDKAGAPTGETLAQIAEQVQP